MKPDNRKPDQTTSDPINTDHLKEYGDWAIVTGGSSGIGQGLTRVLAESGVNCVIVSNQPRELGLVKAELEAECGVRIEVCDTDLSRPDFITDVRRVVSGREIGILINNASYGVVGPYLDNTLEQYFDLIDVNIKAYLTLTHEYMPAMVERDQGALVYVSSLNATTPIARSSVYTATKAFELYLGSAIWYELEQTSVDVLQIMPGPTRTGFQAKAGTKKASWIKAPLELAREALPHLGRSMYFIPDAENNVLAMSPARYDLEERTRRASELLKAAMLDGEI